MDIQIIEWLRQDMKTMTDRIEKIDEKVDQLLNFKYKVIGGTILASLIITAAFQIVLAFIQRGDA